MIVAIMQPTLLPWAGYFDLIDQADVFIYHDNVELSRQSWQQRNRIRTAEGLTWISLPVSYSASEHTQIADARITDLRPIQKARRQLANSYAKAAHAAQEMPWIEAWLAGLQVGQRLADVNIAFIDEACARIGIATPRVRASTLLARTARTPRLVDLCRAVDGATYLSPIGSADYLETEGGAFAEAGLDLAFQNYEHPVWRQQHAPFLAYASAIDLILNEGCADALRIIRSGRREMLSPQAAYARVRALHDQAV